MVNVFLVCVLSNMFCIHSKQIILANSDVIAVSSLFFPTRVKLLQNTVNVFPTSAWKLFIFIYPYCQNGSLSLNNTVLPYSSCLLSTIKIFILVTSNTLALKCCFGFQPPQGSFLAISGISMFCVKLSDLIVIQSIAWAGSQTST